MVSERAFLLSDFLSHNNIGRISHIHQHHNDSFSPVHLEPALGQEPCDDAGGNQEDGVIGR